MQREGVREHGHTVSAHAPKLRTVHVIDWNLHDPTTTGSWGVTVPGGCSP